MKRRLGMIQKDTITAMIGMDLQVRSYPTNGSALTCVSVVAEECFIDNMTVPEQTLALWLSRPCYAWMWFGIAVLSHGCLRDVVMLWRYVL